MTGSPLRWFRLFLAFLLVAAPIPRARAGDAYRPTPAAASPAKPSKVSDDAEATPDDSTGDATGQPIEGAAPTPPKGVPSRPARGKAAAQPPDSLGGDDARESAQTPAAPAADSDRASRMEWEEKARKADARIAAAQARLDEAQLAYTNMRMRGYPSGDTRGAILKEIDDAKAELSAAQTDRASLEDKAREAGVPPSWVMP